MSLGCYILGGPDGHTAIEVSREDWMAQLGTEAWRVALTELPNELGLISTIFLGIDHSFGSGRPILFETMGFVSDAGGGEDYFERYCTWAEAEAGHAAIVRRALLAVEEAAVGLSVALTPAPAEEPSK